MSDTYQPCSVVIERLREAKERNVMSAREQVEAVWALTAQCDGSYRHYAKGTVLIQEVQGQWKDFDSWDAALIYTQKRQQEIASIEEEIALVTHEYKKATVCSVSMSGTSGKALIWQRILSTLIEQRDGLKSGMVV